jgi:hypothetical protein
MPAAHSSARKKAIVEYADRIAPERECWIARNAYYYQTDREYMRFLIPGRTSRPRYSSRAATSTRNLSRRSCGSRVLGPARRCCLSRENSSVNTYEECLRVKEAYKVRAARQNLKIVEVPIHYAGRTYVSRFSDGFMLLRMVLFAFKKLKAI